MSKPPLHLLNPNLQGLVPYTVPERPAVRLDANENPWPLPDDAREELAQALGSIAYHRYPDPRASALRARLAEHLGAGPEELVLGAGSDEVIALLLSALAAPERTVVVPAPTFSMYALSARVRGYGVHEVPLDGRWQLDVPQIKTAIEEHRPCVVFLALPNNPTGQVIEDDQLASILDSAEGSVVAVDEAYAPFWGRTFGSWIDRHPNLVVLGTLSKVGFAAARVGWAHLHRDWAHALECVRQPFNLPAPSQKVAELALGRLKERWVKQLQEIVGERARLEDALSATGKLIVHPSKANFAWAEAPERDASDLARALRKRGIAIRAFEHSSRLQQCVRITVGTPRENDQLLAALRTIL